MQAWVPRPSYSPALLAGSPPYRGVRGCTPVATSTAIREAHCTYTCEYPCIIRTRVHASLRKVSSLRFVSSLRCVSQPPYLATTRIVSPLAPMLDYPRDTNTTARLPEVTYAAVFGPAFSRTMHGYPTNSRIPVLVCNPNHCTQFGAMSHFRHTFDTKSLYCSHFCDTFDILSTQLGRIVVTDKTNGERNGPTDVETTGGKHERGILHDIHAARTLHRRTGTR